MMIFLMQERQIALFGLSIGDCLLLYLHLEKDIIRLLPQIYSIMEAENSSKVVLMVNLTGWNLRMNPDAYLLPHMVWVILMDVPILLAQAMLQLK